MADMSEVPARDEGPDQRPDARSGASASGSAGGEGPNGSAADAPATDAPAAARAPVPFTQQLGRVTVIVLAALFGVFAVTNAQRVAFSWVFGRTEPLASAAGDRGGVPLIVLLLASFVVGALTGALVSRRGGRGR